MTRPGARTLAVLLVIGTLSTAVAVGAQQSAAPEVAGPGAVASDRAGPVAAAGDRPGEATRDRDGSEAGRVGSLQMDGGTNESAPPGGLVSSVVGMEEASVDATVAISRFEERFSAARTEGERAAAVAASLNATRTRVTTLERRLRTLEARRANGSISRGWFAVELSWLLSSAESEGEVVARLERAARRVPRDALARRNASPERIGRLRARVDRLQARDPPGIHRTTFDRQFYRDLAVTIGTLDEDAGATDLGALEDLVDGERVNLYVGSGDPPASVVSFRTTDEARITEFRAGEHPGATVHVRTSEETARRIVNADDPARALSEALLRGEVTIRGVGLLNGLKWGVRAVVLEVFRVLVGIGGWIANVF